MTGNYVHMTVFFLNLLSSSTLVLIFKRQHYLEVTLAFGFHLARLWFLCNFTAVLHFILTNSVSILRVTHIT